MIPKSFKIFGHTYRVKLVKNLTTSTNHLGDVDLNKKLIRIEEGIETESLKQQVYYHELVHTVLDELDYCELSRDESFVNRVANALQQVYETSRY